ncbi:FAD-dependent oxidoreductase [Streptacidiphilus albus]|uniref:FAD-dependent oxidoreductase n=1 Tax=Streptacidiphilus albus TaxID=105425 RepID=UPI0005A8630B|nr:FAD-dependent oxidoreductase [Streptacidiphilus albus]
MRRGAVGPDEWNGGRKPVILALDDDPQVLRALRRDLRSAYADRYLIITVHSGKEAMRILDTLTERRQDLALLLVDQRMPDVPGVQFLTEAVGRFPEARRVLLSAYPERELVGPGADLAFLDQYLPKPWGPPEERLYPVIDNLLEQWWTATVGRLLAEPTAGAAALPTMVLVPDADVLLAPGEPDLIEHLGRAPRAAMPHYECVIVGGGPAGLSAAVQAAAQGLRTLLVDAQQYLGGQAVSAPLIENYLGLPSGLSGAELTRRATLQAVRLGAELICPARVIGLRREDPVKILVLADGSETTAESVLLSPGVVYNRLEARRSARFEGAGLYYGLAGTETQSCIAQRVVVIGAADTAGQAAVHLAKFASEVTLLVRAASLSARMSRYLADELTRTPNISVRTRTTVREFQGGERLEQVVLHSAVDDTLSVLQTHFVFTFIGARPRTDWLGDVVELDDHGFVLTGSDLVANGGEVPMEWSLERAPYPLETSVPGVFAAGDARARSVKRVAAGVAEGAMAVDVIQRYRMSG